MNRRGISWNPGNHGKPCGCCGFSSDGFFCCYGQNGSCSGEHQFYCAACKKAVEPVLVLDALVNG